MKKRILAALFCLFFLFGGIAVSAEEAESSTAAPTEAADEAPAWGGPGGEQMPSGEGMPNGEAPAFPGRQEAATEGGQEGAEQPAEGAPAEENRGNWRGNGAGAMPPEGAMPQEGAMPSFQPRNGGPINPMQGTEADTQQAETTTPFDGFLRLVKTYSTPITAGILLILAFVFVTFYKRRQY